MIWANEEHSPSPKQETRRPDFPRFLRREREREREKEREGERDGLITSTKETHKR